jgi:hypothetical protein
MEQAESDSDSLRVFTREKWSVQLDMAACGIACCSKCGTSGRMMQVPGFKLPACSRVTGHLEVIPGQKSGWGKSLLIRLGIVRPNSGRMTGNSEVIGSSVGLARGFSSLVASTAALIATAWSEPVPGRVYPRCGPAPSRRTRVARNPAITQHYHRKAIC